MSHYKEILPDKSLLPFIECYWVDTEKKLQTICLLILFFLMVVSILFSISEPMQLQGSVVGTMTTHLVVETSDKVDFVGVRFRSGKACTFLNFNASELTDQNTELRNIAGQEGSILTEKLFQAEKLTEKIKILNTNLSSWLRYKMDHRVDYVVQKIIESQGHVSITSICCSLGLSRQHLARLFQEYVGIGPKQFARVIRFQALLKNVMQSPKVNWADEAAMLGYYDQAHLISDFRQFSGTSPEKFTAR